LSYKDKPTAEYITEFGQRQESNWSPQHTEDLRIEDILRRRQSMDVADSKKAPTPPSQIKTVRVGRLGVALGKDTSVLAQKPGLKMNPKKRETEELDHVNKKLEPWLDACWDQSQVGEVWNSQVRDFRKVSRGISNIFPSPRLWATSEYKDLCAKLAAVLDAESPDRKELKEVQAEVDMYLAENFPIRWRWVNALHWWPQWSDERFIPECVEVRTIRKDQYEAEYGEEKVPGPYKSAGGTSQLKLYVYHNWAWTATACPDKDDPQLAHIWDHEMGMNPCILMETNIRDEIGYRWQSPYYDHIDMLETEDEILSDMRHNHRRNTLSGVVFGLDFLARQQMESAAGAVAAGRPPDFKLTPDGDAFLMNGETAQAMPLPQVNQQSLTLLQHVADYNSEIVLNPTLQGRLMSGMAAAGFSIAHQAAQQVLDPYEKGMEKAAKQWVKGAFASVIRLNKEFEEMDEVTAGSVSVSPDDVKHRWVDAQPRFSTLLPANENSKMSLAVGALNLPYHPETIMERYLNDENAHEEVDKWIEWQVTSALIANLVQDTQARAGILSQQVPAGSIQQLGERLAALPPAAQLAVKSVFGPETPAINGQAMSNTMRTGETPNLSMIPGVNA